MRSYRQTGTLPPALRNRPSPGIIASLLVEAFSLLHSSRPAGMNGPEALPLSDISAAADLYGYSAPDEKMSFIRAIHTIDGFYLSQESARIKQERESKRK